ILPHLDHFRFNTELIRRSVSLTEKDSMKTRLLTLLASALTLLAVIPSCSRAQDEIVVGEYGSMTGSEATFGISTDNGVKMAVKECNDSGGINGRKIKLIAYDDQGKQQEAVTAVTRLIQQDHAVAVIGEVASSISIAGGQV